MHRAERHLVADRRLQHLPDVDRSADHQLAEREIAGRLRQHSLDRVLHGPDPIAFDDRELQRVLAGGQARAGGILQRRRHARHDRQQSRVERAVLHRPSVAVGDDVGERQHFRRGVIGADVGVDEHLDLARLRTLQRERRHAKRQRGQEQW